ncbi:hypothetical protein DPMN_136360 [Dreissena polymorpha]|uniref:Uncharacterized protein n=1 Tax=Dreissena polymorpha TaxID=45954 RepID=A0A9D4JHR0_DREPO|nr:hypothetical protein DPMN_136360 [Dreissena polymorpha]
MPYRTDSEAYREPYRGETITIYRPTEYRDTLKLSRSVGNVFLRYRPNSLTYV